MVLVKEIFLNLINTTPSARIEASHLFLDRAATPPLLRRGFFAHPAIHSKSARFIVRLSSVARAVWFAAPGVGMLFVTCAPAACVFVNAALSVIPLPETDEPTACANRSGVAIVIVAPPLPPVVEATIAVS